MNKTWHIAGHKYFEIELNFERYWQHITIFSTFLDIRSQQDHGGISFELVVLNVRFGMALYDNRHWNRQEKRYMTEEERKAEFEMR
jgi:hypothetical protein